jgi:dGTPase
MYRNPNVMRVRGEAEAVLRDLFSAFNADPNRLPDDWQARVKRADEKARVRHITDYIAGMTDRFALQEHRRLFDVTPELR